VESMRWLEKAVHAWSGNKAAIEEIRRAALSPPGHSEHFQRLSILAMCASKDLPLHEVMSAQFSVLNTIIHPLMNRSYWAIFLPQNDCRPVVIFGATAEISDGGT